MNAQNNLLTLGAVLFSAAALAQSYSIDRFDIAGGSGTSSGGDFTLNGGVGQPEAGVMSGGNYSLAGGFWGAIQTPPPVGSVIEAWMVNGQVHLRFTGIPGRTYDIERASSINGPWRPNNQPLAVIIMPIGGVVEFVDTPAPAAPQFFYRTRTP